MTKFLSILFLLFSVQSYGNTKEIVENTDEYKAYEKAWKVWRTMGLNYDKAWNFLENTREWKAVVKNKTGCGANDRMESF